MFRPIRGAGLATLAGIALLCSACTPLTLTARDNGSAVQLRTGRSFKLVLQSRPASGYRWEVVNLDSAVLRQGETLALAEDPRLGTPGSGDPVTVVMSFEALAPGHTQLRLAYRAPLPQPGAAEQTYAADITVH
jgi:predicted secreted protein